MSELLRLCTIVQEQKTVLGSELVTTQRSIIEECLAQPNCQSWFLRKLFKHRHDNDDALSKKIVQHDNCPMQIAAIIYFCKPELLFGSARHSEIQVADLDDSYKGWHTLKQENEDAENLADYISSTIFKVHHGFFSAHVSPFSFCDIREEKMRELYLRAPHVAFEKFAQHPQTPLVKAAYGPIETIAEKLRSMSLTERGIVARRNDLTNEVKEALRHVDYTPELLRLCTLKEDQPCVLPAELFNTDKKIIDQCINQSDCQSWFLNKVFCSRNDEEGSILSQILQHENCPWRIAAIIDFCQPELLEGTSVQAEIQLAHFDPDSLKVWQRYQEINKKERSLEDYIIKVLFKSDPSKQIEFRKLYQRTPEMVFEKFKNHKKSEQFHTFYQPIEKVTERLSTMKAGDRALLTKRSDLTDELKLALVQDSSKLVKKNVLTHTKINDDLLLILAKDDNESIAELALKALPEEIKSQLNQQKANADNALNLSCEKSILAYLRLEVADSSYLTQIATSASPLFCCAATLHKSADQKVIEAALQRKDLPLWAQIGLAQHCADSSLLDTLISKKNFHIQRALCDNPHLSLTQAKTLVEGTKRIEIWAAIANKYIEDSSVLSFIINLQGNDSLWLSQLRRCLDPNVTSAELRNIHNKSECRSIVLSRLIARNPKCSIPLMRLYAYYLPEDIALNPAYGLKLLEEPKRLEGRAYDDWKADEYFTQGYGPECFYDWYLNQNPLHEDISKCPRSRYVNPNKLRPLVILNDSAMHRRFIHDQTQLFSEYEYYILAHIGTPTLKKNLLKIKGMPKELIFSLLQDKDRSVVLAAEKVVKAKKLKVPKVAIAKNESKPAKLTVRSLGNKAARLTLATDSTDLETLKLLSQDKLPDVRAMLAQNEAISYELWFTLLNDPIDKVISSSLSAWRKRTFSEEENTQVQSRLKAIVNEAEFNAYLRALALKKVTDPDFLDSLYQQGEGIFDEEIIKNTSTVTTMEHALFSIERFHNKIRPFWLASNPHLTIEQKGRLLKVQPRLIREIITASISSAELLKTYQNNRAIIDKNRSAISFDRIYNINFTSEDILNFYDEFESGDFIKTAANHLNKLNDDDTIQILTNLIDHEDFRRLLYNENYSEAVQKALLKVMEFQATTENISYFANSYPLSSKLIDKHINSDSDDLREVIAGYQQLNDAQLTLLLNDENKRIWESIFESKKIDNSRLPDWFIRRVGSTHYEYYNFNDEAQPLVIEFNKRGLSLKTVRAGSANALIKQFNAKTTVKNFNQQLTDRGLMEINSRDIEEDEWDENDTKVIGKKTRTISYTQLSALANSYGYSYYDEYDEKSTIAYYPEKFSELLVLLNISKKS